MIDSAEPLARTGMPALDAPGEASLFQPLHALVIAIVTLAVLAPFLGKAYHIDDPMYLWAAQQIREHPLDFYGFDVNWYGFVLPMHEVTQNPPLASYFIALASLAVGWNEFGQHLFFLVPALAWSVGVYVLACRLCSRPLLAATIAVLSPVFMVCATSIMCDVPMTCLWLWAIILWDNGLRRKRSLPLLTAAILIAASALTKYFGAALIPLLLAYSIVRTRGIGLWALWLLAPLAALVAYETWSNHLYGHGIISDAFRYAGDARSARPQGQTALLKGLAFTGGCMLPALFFAPLMSSRLALFIGAMACAALAWAATIVGAWHHLRFTTDAGVNWPVALQVAALIVTGASVLAAAAMDLWRRRDAGAVLLVAWVFGTFVFAALLNWSVTARTILPLAPAVAILIVRRMEDRADARETSRAPANHASSTSASIGSSPWRCAWPLAPSAFVALVAAWSDYACAAASREAAAKVAAMPRSSVVTLWFIGHWGWQHYLQEAGAKPFDFNHLDTLPGDLVAVAVYNSNIAMPPAESADRVAVLEIPTVSWFTVFHPLVGAGFHSSAFGPMPLMFGPVPPERFEVFKAKRTIDAPRMAP